MRNASIFAAGFISCLLLIVAVGLGARLLAQDWMVMSGLAYHLDGRDHCNSVTTGLGIEKSGYAAGFYRNSNCRWSLYAAKSWFPLKFADWRGGLIGGAATGYKSPITPAGGLALAYEGRSYGFNVILVPPISDSSTGVVWLQFKRRWQ